MAFTKIVAAGINTGSSYTFQDLNTVGIVTAGTVQVGAATTVHTTGIDLGSGNITSHNINSTGIITATGFVGPVTGNVTGNVSGNLTGNVTGNVTGNTSGTAGGLTGSPSITVTNITAAGNVSIAGTLTYEDVTNIDAVGIITAQSDISIADKIVHTGNTNTAIRFPAADTISFECAGEEILKIGKSSTELLRISGPVDGSTQQEFGIGIAVNDAHTHPAAKITLKEYDASDSRGDLLFYTRGTNNDVASTERLRITSAGLVGIGTDNPTEFVYLNKSGDYKLHLQSANSDNVGVRLWSTRNYIIQTGPAVNNGIRIYDETPGSVGERLRITSDGDLFVAGTGGMNTTQLPNGNLININGTSSNDGFSIIRYSGGYGAYGLNIGRSKSGTVGTNAIVSNNNDIGHITFYGADGSSYLKAAQITANVDGTPSAGSGMPGRLVFKTSPDGSATPIERLRIDSAGNVSITNNPTTNASKLFIRANSGAEAGKWSDSCIALYNTTGASEYSQMGLGYTLGTWAPSYMGYINTSTSSFGMGALVFGTRGVVTDSQPSEKMRITSGSEIIATSSADFYSGGFFFNVDGNSSNIQYNVYNVGNLSAAGTRPGYRHAGGMWIVLGTVPCDNTYRTMLTSFSGSSGMLHGYCGDASSRNIFQYQWNVTSPAYGVNPFSQRFNNGSWNTGSVALQIATNGSSYDLQIKATSHYSSSNNASFRIIFNTYY